MTRPDADHDEPLTYETATPEQIAAVRAEVRAKLAEAEAKHPPEYYARLRERFGVTRAA
jgi:hypothetical protein